VPCPERAVIFLAWSLSASAASLDMIEVGGAYGTPAATNPSAVWWNPAGLAVRGGTQVLLEAAPTFGGVNVVRDNPNYGELTPFEGFPDAYDYGGAERFSSIGVVPFLGVSSDLTVPGLGVGLGLYVPTAKAANTDQEWGPNRFAARDASIRAVHLSAGASYRIRELVSLGVSASVVDSSFYASTDASVLPDLAWSVEGITGNSGVVDPIYQDGLIEDRAYSSTLSLGGQSPDGGHGALRDRAVTFGAGVYVTPLEQLGISVAWNQGVSLVHEGDFSLAFQCPPEADVTGRNLAQDSGTCNTTVPGTAKVSYRLPSRLHLGVAWLPVERVRLELMGAWVGWGVQQDYAVTPLVNPDDLPWQGLKDYARESAKIINQERLLARGLRDSFWVGVDGKVDVVEKVTVGGRITFDRAAVPTSYVSASNIDADTVILQGMAQYRPVPKLGLGLSYSYAASGARTVTNSVFSQDIARADPNSPGFYDANDAVDRVSYPSANGRYSLGIHRIGVSVQARFGGGATGL
jgi:long-chain fatty acid transport protein